MWFFFYHFSWSIPGVHIWIIKLYLTWCFFFWQMMKVRKMLTEILLDVTNSEIKSVCKEVYLKEKSRASKGRNDRGLCSLYFMWYLSKGEKTYFGQYDIETLLYMCQMIHWLNNVNVCLYKLVTVSVAHTSNTLSLKSVEFSKTIEDLIWRMFTLLPLLILSLILNKYICLSTIHVCIVNILARREKLMLKSHGWWHWINEWF